MAGELVQARNILAIGQRLEIFFENSEEGTSGYSSRVEDIVGDDLVVAMPVDERHVPVIPRARENLYVLAAGDGCPFRFFSTYRKHGRIDARLPVLHMSIPEIAERFQKRGLFRVKVNLIVTVRLVDREGQIDAPVRVRVVDLSGSGMAFVWPKQVPLNSDAALEINDIPGSGHWNLCRVSCAARALHGRTICPCITLGCSSKACRAPCGIRSFAISSKYSGHR